jgi:hypothetical protein
MRAVSSWAALDLLEHKLKLRRDGVSGVGLLNLLHDFTILREETAQSKKRQKQRVTHT